MVNSQGHFSADIGLFSTATNDRWKPPRYTIHRSFKGGPFARVFVQIPYAVRAVQVLPQCLFHAPPAAPRGGQHHRVPVHFFLCAPMCVYGRDASCNAVPSGFTGNRHLAGGERQSRGGVSRMNCLGPCPPAPWDGHEAEDSALGAARFSTCSGEAKVPQLYSECPPSDGE